MATTTAATNTSEPGSKGYRAYVLISLTIMYTLCHVDRVLLSVLQEKIKYNFNLSDFQLGLLGGPAFAFFYAALGLPVARIAERANRVKLISVCLLVWSSFTALFGLSASFLHLIVTRIGVGVGEAGAAPAAHSLISNYFPPGRRATALAVFGLAGSIGTIMATFLGGWIAEAYGWRMAFFALGLPGVAVALLLTLTVREPLRPGRQQETPNFITALKTLWRKRSYRHVVLAAVGAIGLNQAVFSYIVSFLMRTHDLPVTQASQIMGLAAGVCGGFAVVMTGVIADRIRSRHPTAIAWIPAICLAGATPVWVLLFTANSIQIAIPLLMLAAVLSVGFPTAIFTIAQDVAPVRMRATSSAVMLLLATMIGQSLGPPAIGGLSDLFAHLAQQRQGLSGADCVGTLAPQACGTARMTGLRTALIIGALGFLWPAFHFWKIRRTLVADTEQA